MYLFAYFKDNGQDGLHLAYSRDGYKWLALNNDQSVLKPTAGVDKLMRTLYYPWRFFFRWPVSYGMDRELAGKSIGYASSTDLVHWSRATGYSRDGALTGGFKLLGARNYLRCPA